MTALWEDRQVLVCVGSGGVGKTTVAAALGVMGAMAGRRTLVMTIDPARRLANALGLEDTGQRIHQVSPSLLEPHGVRLQAPLAVMMPDVRSTFDELVERLTPDPERRRAIYDNRMYQHFASMLAGSLEYAAVEKLYDVSERGDYDLIVLDTPPAQNARSFLEAPTRVVDFLQHDALRWLIRPYLLAGKVSMRLLGMGSNLIYRTLGRFAGADTLRELANFVLAFDGMYDGFAERASAVHELLHGDDLAFVLVTGAASEQRAAALGFADELEQSGLGPQALVVNRVREPLAWTDRQFLDDAIGASLTSMGPEAVAAVVSAVAEEADLAARDQAAVATLGEQLDGAAHIELPELSVDVHDLESLAQLCHALGKQQASGAGG